jgi:GNAT superfamily N-acetyltransferase
MSAGEQTGISVERVRDLDASWHDLTSLFLEFEAFHKAFQPRELLADWEARLKERLHLNADRLVLLARAGEDAVGSLVGVIRRDDGLAFDTYAYLTYAFVREPHRRSGVGQMLLHAAEQWSIERGASRIELDVFAENHIGVEFWKRTGFRPLSLTMSKPLERAS